jgi:hypothetical protein
VAITAERFNQGMGYDEYKSRLGRGPDQYVRSEQALTLSEADLAAFRGLPSYHVLVLVTETCPDVITNLPILVRIGRETGNFDHRIFMRDDNKDLMAQFMNGPYESVPVFAFFDADFTLHGVFIERPSSVTSLREQKTRELHEQHPEFGAVGASAADLPEDVRDRLRAATQQLREDTATFYRRESIRELQDVVKTMSQASADARPLWVGNLMMPVPA